MPWTHPAGTGPGLRHWKSGVPDADATLERQEGIVHAVTRLGVGRIGDPASRGLLHRRDQPHFRPSAATVPVRSATFRHEIKLRNDLARSKCHMASARPADRKSSARKIFRG